MVAALIELDFSQSEMKEINQSKLQLWQGRNQSFRREEGAKKQQSKVNVVGGGWEVVVWDEDWDSLI